MTEINETQMEAYMQALQEKQRKANQDAKDATARGEAPDHEFLVFAVAGEEFAAPLKQIRGVVALPATTPVPFLPDYHRGIVNVRGQILSIIDLRVKMGVEAEITPETAVLVLENGDAQLGVVVDRVNRVLAVKTVEEVRPVRILDVAKTINGGKP